MTFEEWMRQVNRIIAKKLGGMTQDDLPDWNSRDCFDSGATPEDGANECIEEFCESMCIDPDEMGLLD